MAQTDSRAQTVSVVLLNWNGGAVSVDAAAAVRAQTCQPLELVVVDNASDDGSLDRIESTAMPDVIIRHDRNLGFSAGMNAGASAATGDIVVLLNHDAMLAPDFVEMALTCFDEHADAGMVAGWAVEDAEAEPVGPRGFTASMRVWELPNGRAREVPAIAFSSPVLRAAFIADIIERFGELLDSSYDTYGEDVDLCARAHHTRWSIRFDPRLRSSHVGASSSAARVSDKRGRLRRNIVQNRHRNVTRHSRPGRVLLNRGFAVVEDLGFVAFRLAKRDPAAVRDVGQAWIGAGRTHAGDTAFRRQHGGLPRSVANPRYRPLMRR